MGIYLIGDLHGDFRPVREFYNFMPKEEDNILVVLGDFGGNYYFNQRDNNFKEKLGKYNITYFIVRGNHEQRPSICKENNPENWHTEFFWDGIVYVENEYPYIKYAVDCPSIYNIPIENKKLRTLILPGAYSVDKKIRLERGWSWFPQEQCDKTERNCGLELAKEKEYDLILSHTCPAYYEPNDLFLSVVDQSTVDKTTEYWLNEVYYNLKSYKLWAFGHYHKLRVYPIDKEKNGRMVMLFNDAVLDIKSFFREENPYDSIIKIY